MRIFQKKQSVCLILKEKNDTEAVYDTCEKDTYEHHDYEKNTHDFEMTNNEEKAHEVNADIEDDTEEESPWDPKPDATAAPDPFMAASGAIYVPEAKKQVVTASGKVIETETDLLKEKVRKYTGGRGSSFCTEARSIYGTKIIQCESNDHRVRW